MAMLRQVILHWVKTVCVVVVGVSHNDNAASFLSCVFGNCHLIGFMAFELVCFWSLASE